MHKLILVADSVGIATMYALLGYVEPIEETPRNATRAECIQFPSLVVRFPIYTLLRTTINRKPLSEFTIGFVERKPPPPLPPEKAQTTIRGHGAFALTLMTPIYVDFYERYRLWVKEKFGGDSYSWPPLINFARVFRNAVSHHEGHIHFDNQSAGPVSWHGLTYSPADEGRKILAADFDIGDLIVLMFELSDLLDQHGCPPNP